MRITAAKATENRFRQHLDCFGEQLLRYVEAKIEDSSLNSCSTHIYHHEMPVGTSHHLGSVESIMKARGFKTIMGESHKPSLYVEWK